MRFLIVASVLLLFSCKSKPKDPLGMKLDPGKCVSELFFSDETKDFGKYRVGMSRADFDEQGTTSVIYHNVHEVIDSVPLCKNPGIYTEVTFLFNESHLSDIEAHFYLTDNEQLKEILQLIQEKLSKKHGTPLNEQGILSWKDERENSILRIYLSDETFAYNRSVIRLAFYTEGNISV